MKKINLFLIFLIFNVIASYSQEWVWSGHLSSANKVDVVDIAIDENDNTYLIGTYEISALSIQGTSIPNQGDIDGFLCKLSPDGSLEWLRGIGGLDREYIVSCAIVDNSIFVSGDFRSASVFFTDTDSLIRVDNYDAFLAEYDLEGNFIDASSIFYGTHIQRIKGMVYNPAENNLLIIGQFQNEFKYTDGVSEFRVTPKGVSGKDHFVVKANLSGHVQDTVFSRQIHLVLF